jgi:archaeosine synthase beta-subunit
VKGTETEAAAYPLDPNARDRWILERRPPRKRIGPHDPIPSFVEEEPSDESDGPVSVATLFLTNRECAWRCLFCDLWQATLPGDTPAGAIPEQIRKALETLPPARFIKLYNAGSFFDRRSVPVEDHPEIARLVRRFQRVIVECHPALVGDGCLPFRDLVSPAALEVAVGLETVHPEILERLNKRMTVTDFRRAAKFLSRNEIGLRVFLLVGLPFLTEEDSLLWAARSVSVAFDSGARTVSLIATRPGNGALGALQARGEFTPPSLRMLERSLEAGLALGRGRVLADTWDLEAISRCPTCLPRRVERLRLMNRLQTTLPVESCDLCR